MILKQISKGDNHYLKKKQPSLMEGGAVVTKKLDTGEIQILFSRMALSVDEN
jgi:hypothetical protein